MGKMYSKQNLLMGDLSMQICQIGLLNWISSTTVSNFYLYKVIFCCLRRSGTDTGKGLLSLALSAIKWIIKAGVIHIKHLFTI